MRGRFAGPTVELLSKIQRTFATMLLWRYSPLPPDIGGGQIMSLKAILKRVKVARDKVTFRSDVPRQQKTSKGWGGDGMAEYRFLSVSQLGASPFFVRFLDRCFVVSQNVSTVFVRFFETVFQPFPRTVFCSFLRTCTDRFFVRCFSVFFSFP